ncbi:MAG: hypothetical protein LBD75_04520 [Candidatus Peribacteria bacterium]|jgi:hypothetical protein|nr:hypothetical protein [Candidatus Peribacteria bacterium]
MYHLFQILENSLQGVDNTNIDIYINKCRDFKKDIQKLNKLIGKKESSTPTNTTPETASTTPAPSTAEPTETQVSLPSALQNYFTPEKRVKDTRDL